MRKELEEGVQEGHEGEIMKASKGQIADLKRGLTPVQAKMALILLQINGFNNAMAFANHVRAPA